MTGFLSVAMDAALRAGGAILEIYKRDFEVELKADASPLTEADKDTFYTQGPEGYTDYPSLKEQAVA